MPKQAKDDQKDMDEQIQKLIVLKYRKNLIAHKKDLIAAINATLELTPEDKKNFVTYPKIVAYLLTQEDLPKDIKNMLTRIKNQLIRTQTKSLS